MSAEDFAAIEQHSRQKFDSDRKRFLAEAKAADDGGWNKHSEFHWSRQLAGKRLDFWPSRKKFQFDGKIRRGDVYAFIRAREK